MSRIHFRFSFRMLLVSECGSSLFIKCAKLIQFINIANFFTILALVSYVYQQKGRHSNLKFWSFCSCTLCPRSLDTFARRPFCYIGFDIFHVGKVVIQTRLAIFHSVGITNLLISKYILVIDSSNIFCF